MEKISTRNSLVSLVYHELSDCEAYKLKQKMLTDISLRDEYKRLKKTLKIVEGAQYSPTVDSLSTILSEAKIEPKVKRV